MARPQNGVNGSIPQQSFGFIQNQFMPNPVQRNNNPNMYGYSDMQQVVPSHFQGFAAQQAHNVAGNLRQVAPMVSQPQYTYYQYQQQPQYGQYPFQPSYLHPQQFVYQMEASPQPAPVSYQAPTRKLNPLVVVDPVNHTDLDLSKYQSHPVTEQKFNVLVESLKHDKNEGMLDKIKIEEVGINIVNETTKENQSECIEIETMRENIEIEEIEENIPREDLIKNIDKEETLQSEEIQNEPQDLKENNEDPCKEEIGEESKNEKFEEGMIKNELILEKPEIEADSNTQGSNTEEESPAMVSDKNSVKYFLQINKKESDETILRRKLIYDREYLITLKSNSKSQKKPVNFPVTDDFLEIIYSESQNITCSRPDASQTSSNSNDRSTKKQPMKYQPNNRKYNKQPQMQPQPKLINLDLNESQILKRSKSSYLPPQLRSKDKEVDPYLELKRNIKCNLNKITPQNFQDCLSEINKLNIKEKDEMSCLIGEIFIKAVQEEAYSVTYAQFCNKLAQVYTENQTFKGQLLKKCQDMFQTPIQEQLDNVRKDWTLKIDAELEPKMKILYESDIEEQVKKAKDRYFGNIRFIGELFLHHLLAGKVILNCIVELLKGKGDTDALLALCKLMETCGKQIDERHKDHMNSFIRSIDDLSKSKELETRIRFKLKDIVDMRLRDWTLRHIQQEKKINPKTMEEQKEEAAAEAAVKLAASQTPSKRSHQTVQGNQVRRQISAQQRPIAVKNLTFTSHLVDEKTVLGPSRGNWIAGSGSKSKSREADTWSPILPKYATSTRSPDQSPQVKVKNRYKTLESSAEGSGADSRSSSPLITHPKNVSNTKNEMEISDDDRADQIFNDLMLTGKFDVNNWLKIVIVKPIIEKWIDYMMEKDLYCRRTVGESFNRLIHENIMSHEQLIDGAQAFVSCISDLICDIPKLWEFFSEFLESFICGKNSDISFFQNIFKDLIPNKDVAICLSMTLHAASSRLGHDIVGQVFHKSALKWEDIVPNDWTTFVEQHQLHFTIDGGAPLSQCGGFPLESIADSLQMMLADDVSNEAIFGYLEKHIDKPTWKSSECVRTITTCILRAMKNMPKHMMRVYLKDKSEIIRQISQNKFDNEMEILRSILMIANELDKELLTIVYDVIMTGKIVSKKAFVSYLTDASMKSDRNFDLTYQIIDSQLYVTSNHR